MRSGRGAKSTAAGKLEALPDAPVSLFAYPNGRPGVDYRVEHVRMVKDLGFEAAVCRPRAACATPEAIDTSCRASPRGTGRFRGSSCGCGIGSWGFLDERC